MVEFIQNGGVENVARLSPKARKEARGSATEIWKISNRFIQDKQAKLIPTDLNYLEIIFTGQKELEVRGEKEMDLIIQLTSMDCSEEIESARPLPGESFYFLTIDGGHVVKETRNSGSQQVERHEADKEELEKLLKIIRGSRSIESCIVP
ncbi:MAG: hypothetical protein Q8P29_00830 [Candidatus Levybacteria bacterium]|nr:hypothetical protein [Candidatus Levybacteria bacterium]MDZ4227803.1 hypothetical protein [Candidatus Levybacteria bacterium]